MYGLPQSPRDCGITRDLAITDTQITVPAAKARERGEVTEEGVPPDVAGKPLVLRPSAADSQVWSLRVLVSDGNTAGPWVAVYVDDVFIMGPVLLATAIVDKFKETWEVGSVQRIPRIQDGFASFFGIEFAWKGDQLVLGQQGYVRICKRGTHTLGCAAVSWVP